MNFQENLHKEMLDSAKVKDTQHRTKAIQKQTETHTKGVRRIMGGIMALFAERIEKWLRDAQSRGGFRHSAWPFLNKFDPDLIAYVSSKMILNSISTQKPVTALCMKIGQALEAELHYKIYTKEHPVRACVNKRAIMRRVGQLFKLKSAYASIRASNTKINYLTPTERLHIGFVCLNLFIESTGLVKIYKKWESPKKSVNMIKATDECLKWIKDYTESSYILPRFLPSVEKPKPWSASNFFAGGYSDPRLAYPAVKLRSKPLLEELSKAEMAPVYDSMNKLQETPWKINRWLFQVMEEFWTNGLDDGTGIPLNKVLPLPPKPAEGANKETIRAYTKKAAFVHSKNVEMSAQRVVLAQIIHAGKKFLAQDSLYFPVQADFRGRLYYVPGHLNPQGTDHAKALLEFSEGRRLDSHGLNWMAYYGSGLFGLGKQSRHERTSWASSNSLNIKRCAENPFHFKWWTEAEKPWQFLRWCKEYSDATTKGGFISHLPVTLDCTASGLQILSLLSYDQVTAKYVNLINSEVPQDIYKIVLGTLMDLLHKDGTKWADFWIKARIDRKLVKQPVLAMPYGISINGIRNWIEQWYYTTHGMDNINLKDFWGYSMSLSRLFVTAMRESMPKIVECMKYLEAAGRIATKDKDYKLSWTTPSGFKVVQPYMKTNSKVVKTSLHGNFVYPVLREEDGRKINRKKQVASLSPNFIHSLDASILHFVVKEFSQILAVHDCFGTHANKINLLVETLKNTLISIFEKDVLFNFYAELTKTNSAISGSNTFQKGDFLIGQLKGGEYIFV